MKKHNLFKFLTYISTSFTIVILIELIVIILFSTIIELNLGPYTVNLFTMLFVSGFTSFDVILEWILLLTIICGFLALNFALLLISIKKKKQNIILAKFLLLIGIFFLISGLIKMFSIYLLANSVIKYNGSSIVFQTALYTDSITPFLGGVMWIYISAVTISILILGLVFGGIGLKTMLKMEEKSTT
ncbi:MAG: hypothetical protein ACFE8M_07555 [Candidatus Hermodarchaeota archaeon]